MNNSRSVQFIIISFLIIFALSTDNSHGKEIWIDPSFKKSVNMKSYVKIWFDAQVLEQGDSFERMKKQYSGEKRSRLRKKMITALKATSDRSFERAKPAIYKLVSTGKIKEITRHWIINGFTCRLMVNNPDIFKNIPGIYKVFRVPVIRQNQKIRELGPRFIPDTQQHVEMDFKNFMCLWNMKKLHVDKVWKEFGITGEGVLSIIHDFGFKLDVPVTNRNLYRNMNEVPGNRKDDDNNGYVDDYHGFNFIENSSRVNIPEIRNREIIHGNLCAGLIAGSFLINSNILFGAAPGSKWAPVIADPVHIEQSVQWAVEQDADIYSMSFSIPKLGEYRSHLRKIMESGTLCGIYFVSGAGNFANESKPDYAPVPDQMRFPEDIPEAVFGVAGLDRNMVRPPFSSQGPVRWETQEYREGLVKKPDFVTFNANIELFDTDGNRGEGRVNGNSFAGPHLAGVLALMLSADKDLLPWEAKKILIDTSKDVHKKGFDFQTGYGLVDAYEAVREVLRSKHLKTKP
ncbi:S8 family serine peptidase [Thermodesulfobacteriota bacterium]